MRKSIKAMLFGMILIMSVLFTSCAQPDPVKAEEGWNNNEKVVRVTDSNGEQFLMTMLLYNTLMNNGGYNNVVNHYYTNPGDTRYKPVTASYRVGKPINNFKESYTRAVKTNKVYKPSQTTLTKAYSTRSKLHGSAYRASNNIWRSSGSSYKPSTKSSSGSSYRSSSGSSYRSSGSSFRSSSSFRGR